MQTPTIGAALLYQPQHPDTAPHRDEPLQVAVTAVHTDRLVDVEGAETDGAHFFETRVMLLQDEDDAPVSGRFAYWPGAEHQASPVARETPPESTEQAGTAVDDQAVAETAAAAANVRAEHAETAERDEDSGPVSA